MYFLDAQADKPNGKIIHNIVKNSRDPVIGILFPMRNVLQNFRKKGSMSHLLLLFPEIEKFVGKLARDMLYMPRNSSHGLLRF